eukprot:TRINITY_DN17133_c0_g1_i10.p1 TRINITY_DN17133_c0_g1~~TRINITY_DN17133_c0_g1_i10.p1  ORF type:complete len:173 (-),score=36.29 TRINITY_DN17133_c0_g1_i10:183-701(-)
MAPAFAPLANSHGDSSFWQLQPEQKSSVLGGAAKGAMAGAALSVPMYLWCYSKGCSKALQDESLGEDLSDKWQAAGKACRENALKTVAYATAAGAAAGSVYGLANAGYGGRSAGLSVSKGALGGTAAGAAGGAAVGGIYYANCTRSTCKRLMDEKMGAEAAEKLRGERTSAS